MSWLRNVLRDLPESTWKESFSLSMMVEAISSYAEFQLEDPEFNQVLAGLIVSRGGGWIEEMCL